MIIVEAGRDIVIDLLDPLLVVRSDKHKVLPGKQREQMRTASRWTAMICSAVALWDILLHPLPPGLLEAPTALVDENTAMLVRWGESPSMKGEQWLLDNIAEALEIDATTLGTQTFVPEHRLLVFTAKTETATHVQWKAFLTSPKGSLLDVVDHKFPGALNGQLCLEALAEMERSRSTNDSPQHSDVFKAAIGDAKDAHKAYLAACDWWRSTLEDAGIE